MNLATTTVRMWTAAHHLVATIRTDLTTAVTGARWRRPARQCPGWCGQGHLCTARHGYPSGQHRSAPAAWSTSYGSLVATRVAAIGDSGNRIELRAVVGLPADDTTAGRDAEAILTAVHLILTTLTTPTPEPLPAATPRPALPAAGRPSVLSGGPA